MYDEAVSKQLECLDPGCNALESRLLQKKRKLEVTIH